MDPSRGDIYSNVMVINVTNLRAMMDNIMQRYATLVSPLPPFLRKLVSQFFVGSEEEASADVLQILEVIPVEQIALSIHISQE